MRTHDTTDFSSTDVSLRALAYELKQPLIRIARQAELGNVDDFAAIQQTAEQTLHLLDTYLLSAQTEYGQVSLDLSPVQAGAVLYDVSTQLRSEAQARNISLILDSRAHETVMTHRPALTSIMKVFGSTLIGMNHEAPAPEITVRSYKTRTGAIGVGMFTQTRLSQADLRQALALQGRAHMPLSRLSGSAHISLAIADSLCKAIGGSLTVKKMGALSGFATELPHSEQLALV